MQKKNPTTPKQNKNKKKLIDVVYTISPLRTTSNEMKQKSNPKTFGFCRRKKK